ncbi:LCP family protein [filamentous cyanobacterium LEGE 11480]|uniref:LCP family protein n=2 Tax=Romeriopsis TaxID=2992131 RepID=A0A928VNL2_9CYAN|nr:LCP family protein [Romeriopsis navalis LEGE 11480]
MGRRTPKTTKATSKGRRVNWLVLCLAGVGLLSATAGALLAVSLSSTPLMQRKFTAAEASIFKKGEISRTGNLKMPALTRPVNILVMGTKVLSSDLDNIPAELQNQGYHSLVNSFEGLTDTMLLIRFNPEDKKLSVLSIPRDTRTEIPGVGVRKINDANAEGGPALAARSASNLLGGVGIDRYVILNVQGVEALVNALGGITVHVPKDMKYQDDSQHLYINLKAGRQRLNGDQVLQLLRFRYDEYGDIGRIQRQQIVMRALMEQALNPATITRLPQILSVIQSHLDTNLSVEELVALVGYGAQVNRSNTQMLMLPGEFSNPGEFDASYWLPSYSRIDDIMARHFNFGTVKESDDRPESVRVTIQDGTEQPELAQDILGNLREAGYADTGIGQPWNENLSVTRIVAQQGDSRKANAIREALGFGEVRIETTGDLASDVTIQLGKDALRKRKQTDS